MNKGWIIAIRIGAAIHTAVLLGLFFTMTAGFSRELDIVGTIILFFIGVPSTIIIVLALALSLDMQRFKKSSAIGVTILFYTLFTVLSWIAVISVHPTKS